MIKGSLNGIKFLIDDDDNINTKDSMIEKILVKSLALFKLEYPSTRFYWHNYLAEQLETNLHAEIIEFQDKQELEDKDKNIIY